MKALFTVAQKEFADGVRNRWLVASTLVFAGLAISISWFGSASVGAIGFSSIANTVVSLSSLNVFLVPLIALMLSYDTIVGEDADGTLLLLLTYPLSRLELLAGKFVGHSLILTVAIAGGFACAAVVIALFVDNLDISLLFKSFGLLIVSAILLGMVFISLAYLVSTLVTEKSKAAGMSLVVWFFFVLVYDMGLLGLLVATEGQIQADIFPYLLLFNPTDVFRLVNLLAFEGEGSGILSLASGQVFSSGSLFTTLLVWIAVPFSLAYWQLKKRLV